MKTWYHRITRPADWVADAQHRGYKRLAVTGTRYERVELWHSPRHAIHLIVVHGPMLSSAWKVSSTQGVAMMQQLHHATRPLLAQQTPKPMPIRAIADSGTD